MSISVKQLKKILGSFSTAVAKDVSGIKTAYVTKKEVEDFAKVSDLNNVYMKKNDIHIEDFVLAATFRDAYNNRLVKKEDMPALDTIATKQEISDAVAAIQVPSIEGLAKESEVEAKLADYAKTTEVAATYATKEAVNAINGLDADTIATLKNLSEHSDLTAIANKVDNVYTKTETDDKLATKADVTAIPSIEGLAKTTDIETTYAKKSELPDVSGLATKQEVTDAVAGVQVPSIEGLAKVTDVDTKLAAKADVSAIPNISNLATKEEVSAVDNKLATKADASAIPSIEGLAKTTEVETKLADYAKKVELPSIEGLAKTSEVEATYAKKSELPSIEGLATKAEITEAVTGLAKASEVAETYATKEAVNAVAGLDADTVSTLKTLAQNSDLTTVAEKVKNVYTKAETDDKLATKADVTAIPDISGLATKQEITAAVAGITVPSIEGLAKTTDVDTKLIDYAKKTELPSIEGLAKVTEVDTKLAAKADVSAIPDVSGLATKAEVATVDAKFATKADVSAIPSIEGLAKTTDIEAAYAKKTELPDVSGLATKAEVEALKTDFVTEETLTQNINQFSTNVDDKINEAKGELEAKVTEVDGKLADYAKKTELPSVEGLAKATEIESTYAKKTELPDVSGLATKAEVAAITVPSIEGLAKTTDVDTKLADYAKKTELPNIEGLAKTTDVEAAYAKKTELPDVSGLATKAELPSIEGLAKTTEVVAKSVYDEKVQSLESEISALKAKLAAVASGTTEQRPTENLVVGQQYFDTTLGVPVYWNGTEWHNPFANITTVEVENH